MESIALGMANVSLGDCESVCTQKSGTFDWDLHLHVRRAKLLIRTKVITENISQLSQSELDAINGVALTSCRQNKSFISERIDPISNDNV